MKLFTVLGMHRSGTSVVARGLNMLGATLGPEEKLMPPKPDNPEGFWESLDIAQLHDDLFSHFERRWDYPPIFEDGWQNDDSTDDFVLRMRGIVDSHFQGAATAAWKDPRGSFFMPLWRKAVPIAGTMLCVRWPDDVARSLSRREGLNTEFVAANWIRYTVAAYYDNAGALILPFDATYESPDRTLRELAAFLGLAPPSAKTIERFRSFVKPELRHASESVKRPGRVLQLARSLFTIMTKEPAEVVTPIVQTLADRFRLERYMDDQAGEMRAYRDLIGPSIPDLLRDIDTSREPA